MEVRLAYPGKDILGEGPVWVPEEMGLYWVDIQRPCLQRWQPADGEYKKWIMPADIGCFALRKQGGAVMGLRTGFALLDFTSGEVFPIHDPEADLPSTRFNDGKCDRRGRFWAGTMDEDTPKTQGALYRLSPDMTYRKVLTGIGVSNGLGWSPDNNVMYYTDSRKHTIWAYDYDLESGSIANQRIFAQTPETYVPDGLTVDAAGFVWSAKWDGWKVVRYTPDGSIDLEVQMPVQRPTSCMFGGPELRQLYITSASTGLSDRELAKQPLAGSVFVLETDFSGLPEPRFAG
jgi:sugar lactone lactonase YvrE